MNEELALLTIGYLVGYYKTHEETIINKDEIDAINFIIEKNETLEQELQKYKSLYENEKDHTDTLKRIIHNVSENIYNLIDECNSIIGNKESSIVSKNQLMIMQREELTKILDLLKEIK